MKVFVLILFIKHGYGGGLTAIEFASLAECEQAAVAISETFRSVFGNQLHTCIEKTLYSAEKQHDDNG